MERKGMEKERTTLKRKDRKMEKKERTGNGNI